MGLNLRRVGVPATPEGSPIRAARRLLITQSDRADMLNSGLNPIGEHSLRVVTRDVQPISRAAALYPRVRAIPDGLWDD